MKSTFWCIIQIIKVLYIMFFKTLPCGIKIVALSKTVFYVSQLGTCKEKIYILCAHLKIFRAKDNIMCAQIKYCEHKVIYCAQNFNILWAQMHRANSCKLFGA